MALNYQAAVNITATYNGAPVNRATQDFKKFDGTIKGTIGGLTSLKSAFGAFAGAIALREVGRFAKSLIDLGDNLGELRQKTGIGVQALSDLKTAAELNGVEFEQFETSLKKFSSTLVKAQAGSREAAAGFKALGLSAKDFKNADEALFAIAEKFKLAEDGAEKAAVAVALFGKTGADLIPVLNQGKKELEGLGLQMSEDFVKQSDEFNDNLVKMKGNLQGFGVSILEFVLPALNKFIEKMRAVSASSLTKLPLPFSLLALGVKAAVGSNKGGGTNDDLNNLRGEKGDLLAGPVKIDASGLGGKDRLKSLENETNAIARLKEELEELEAVQKLETNAVNLSTAEYQKQKIALEEKTKADKAVVGFSAKNKAAYMEVTEAIILQKQAMIDLQEAQKQSFGVGAKQAMKEYSEAAMDTAAQTKQLFSSAFKGLEDALVSFVQTGKLSFQDLANTISEMLIRMAVQKSIAAGIAAAGFAFADGGIMTASGPVALKSYASGGIARSPQLALFGEGSTPEAFVPLPDGRSIPVSMKGGGSGGTNVTVNVNISNSGESQDAASDTEQGKQLGNLISAAVTQEILKQKRPGGMLA